MNSSKNDPIVTVLPESAGIPLNDSTRCLYRYANGKRFRLTGSQPHFPLCPHHFSVTKPTASLELYNDADDLSAHLLPQLSAPSPSILPRHLFPLPLPPLPSCPLSPVP